MPTATGIDDIRRALQCSNPHCSCHKGPNVHCPAHEDQNPSFTVSEGRGGMILFHCHKGCTQRDVLEALKQRELWPPIQPERSNGRNDKPKDDPVAIYEYRDEFGQLVAIKGRFEYGLDKKSFKWKLPDSHGWTGLGGKPMSEVPLWGVEMLRDWPVTGPVFVVEGEKAAAAARDQGLMALTHPGGASTTDFGNSFDVLKGRNVFLWPDNDEPGRRFMSRIHALLRPIAKSVTVLNPPVPEKGDAYDYFKLGGTVADLMAGAPPTEPVVDYLSHDAIRVRMPTCSGVFSFTFSNMEKTARELDSELEVSLDGNGEPYSLRLNLLSMSQVTELRRNLELVYGKDLGWPQLLNGIISKARKAYLEQDRALKFINIPDPGPPVFLIRELLPSGFPTVWFGTGSSCKSYIALRVAISVATGTPFLGLPVKKGGVLVVDYESNASNFKFRLKRLLAGIGMAQDVDYPIQYWPAFGIPLSDQIEAIKGKVVSDGITLLIVDSALSACGGKPEDAEITGKYFRSLSRLGEGVTTLTIAHVTKGSDEMRPFGSIFWENLPRRTVNFARTDDEDTDDMDVAVFVRKTNEGKKPKPIAFHVHFENEVGPVIIEPTDIRKTEHSSKRSLVSQIIDVLTNEMTAYEIAEALGNTDKAFVKTISSTLNNKKDFFYRVEGSKGGRGNQTKWAKVERRS